MILAMSNGEDGICRQSASFVAFFLMASFEEIAIFLRSWWKQSSVLLVAEDCKGIHVVSKQPTMPNVWQDHGYSAYSCHQCSCRLSLTRSPVIRLASRALIRMAS
jgi:hypothetical protein